MRLFVEPVSAETLPAALRLVSPAHESDEDIRAAIAAAKAGGVDFRRMLVARDGERIVGAVMVMAMTDEAAMLWPPAVAEFESTSAPANEPLDTDAVACAMLEEATRRLDAESFQFAQVLLDADETPVPRLLRRYGFDRVADLQFMACPVDGELPLSHWEDGELRRYSAITHAEFVATIERTYVASLDCPGLGDVRRGEQALAGHRQSGEFDPGCWQLLVQEGQPAGLLLLNPHPDREAWELCYFGITPEFRGRGLGTRLLKHGLSLAGRSGAREVFLAVDAANAYAKAIYESMGFVGSDSRQVMVRRLGGVVEK